MTDVLAGIRQQLQGGGSACIIRGCWYAMLDNFIESYLYVSFLLYIYSPIEIKDISVTPADTLSFHFDSTADTMLYWTQLEYIALHKVNFHSSFSIRHDLI